MNAWHCTSTASLVFLHSTLVVTGAFSQDTPSSALERTKVEQQLKSLEESLAAIPTPPAANTADASIFAKGIVWALRYDSELTPADIKLLKHSATRGKERAELLAAGKKPWTERRGKLALGYRSRVDGSVQPYGLIVPKSYDAARPMRLDVVLHGSTRPVGMSELRFMARFDEGDGENPSPPDHPYLELHPLGRVENCYRWAGETDVFEALEDVCRRYTIDRRRIVLRGMSMGASGTWHLGLKHPDKFVALGPYCGYVDTHRFSETPLDNFVKVGPLPAHQELGLHMLDSIDYAANAGVVPAIACMGEKDVFFQAHVLMGEAFEREGLKLNNIISPGTGHVIDPATHAKQMRQIGEHAARGLDPSPKELRFVTWTLKYSRCHWLQVLTLGKHYARAEISAHLRDDVLEIGEPKNITRFAILVGRPTKNDSRRDVAGRLASLPKKVRIGASDIPLPDSVTPKSPGLVFARDKNGWRVAGDLGSAPLAGKRPGLQGPIDDAFTTPFLCVRGTGKPWNAAVQAYADASLKQFAEEWRHYFRGDLPMKDDTAVTDEDVLSRNLVLFGDPGSNAWIAKALPRLPIKWTAETLKMAGREYSSSEHLPALITACPLPGGEERYLVLNSGHTFREAELAKLNYLLFPRWGDWAALKIVPREDPTAPLAEEVLQAGYFDEGWQFP